MLRNVIKASGIQERFDKEKLVQTMLRAGARKDMALDIAGLVEKTLSNNSTTHSIYAFAMDELEKRSSRIAAVFGLREAIADLDSVSFEKYAAKVLEADGYKCIWNRIIDGRCIDHQIDIIAEKNGEFFYIECKRHYNPHRFCGLEVPLEVWARLIDLQEGFGDGKNKYNFSKAWIFTNSKFSEHAMKYATAKGVMMTGWSIGLQDLIEARKIYPVTILNIDLVAKAELLRKDIITLQDVLGAKKAKMPNWDNVIEMAHSVLGKRQL
ncbi:MAG: restriction endonuclease [Candidatus Aenigmarchaeota archaeon]|nr:restriction endonuclease [Candidatus Aenigmarchaeota archaeon]